MKEFVRIFKSPLGDIYHITLSEETSILSAETLQAIKGTDIIGIDLRRLAGNHSAGHDVLHAIEDTIANYFFQRENIIICYYCDFINPIPRTMKNAMPPQEYRSHLFERMFQRYTQLHEIRSIHLSVVEINGMNESYFFHVIYHERQKQIASIIANDLREGYGK